MKINAKMLLSILSTSMLIFIISIGYITTKARQMSIEEAKKVTKNKADEYVNVIKTNLLADFYKTKTLAQIGQSYQKIPWEEWIKIFDDQQFQIICENPHYLAVATSWELQQTDPEWKKPFGRVISGWTRDEKGNITKIEINRNFDGDDISSDYYHLKITGESSIDDPELWSPTGKIEDQYINTNFSVPIKLGNTFIGLAGIDVDLERFQDIIKTIVPLKNSFSCLLSNNGTYVTSSDPELIGKQFNEIHPEINDKFKIIENIQSGKDFSFIYKDFFYVFAPLKVKDIHKPWSVAFVVPKKTLTIKAQKILYISLVTGFIGFIMLSIVIWFIARNISNPIIKVTNVLTKLAGGKIDKSLIMDISSKDEIGEMTRALNTSIAGLNTKTEFANLIGSGNIDAQLELLSEDDMLGIALNNMRNNIKTAKDEEEKRKIEDEKQKWANEGLAKFSDILRKNNDNIEILSNEIIKNLVFYLKSNQGGLFVADEEDSSTTTFNLLSAFAYDREKFIEKQVELGEGLVGTCAAEKETIYLTEIPNSYTKITSGLGGANPNSLLIVPLIIENDVLGVIEMASFNKFEPHEIKFVESVAESIASTLKSVRINIMTSHLLEQSQQQSEEMSAQEEEMRQNMEELQATQEESTRKGSELNSTIEAIDSFLLKAEFDLDFTIINANEAFLNKFEYNIDEIIGVNAKSFIAKKDIAKFQTKLNKTLGGVSFKETTNLISKSGNKLKLITSFTPVFIDERIDKILLLAIDITDFK